MQLLFKLCFAAFTLLGGLSVRAITLDVVQVGNGGNAPDTTGFGAVAYDYQIGKYEVTNDEYAAFLNAVASTDTFSLYDHSMFADAAGGILRSGPSGSYTYAVKIGFSLKPVNFVSYWDATRFANWLNNGQGGASTETGSYTLGGVAEPVNTSVARNAGAVWAVASEDEWYKAAFFDPTLNSGSGGYWKHATQSNSLGDNTAYSAPNGANYNDGDFANGGLFGPGSTDAGAYVLASSYYGTFDQNGNVYEWNESLPLLDQRGRRGGAWNDSGVNALSTFSASGDASGQSPVVGFRVVNLALIPEPSAYGIAFGFIALGALAFRREKREISG